MSAPNVFDIPIESEEGGFHFNSEIAVNPNGYPIGALVVFFSLLFLQIVTFALVVFNMRLGMYDECCFSTKCKLPVYKGLLEEPEHVYDDSSRDTTVMTTTKPE